MKWKESGAYNKNRQLGEYDIEGCPYQIKQTYYSNIQEHPTRSIHRT